MVFTRIVQPGLRRKYMYSPGERTIFRISGTIIPRVWPMALLSTVLAIALCFIYDPLRRAERQGLALTKLLRDCMESRALLLHVLLCACSLSTRLLELERVA